MDPVRSDNPLQLVPNSNAITIPDTTPMSKDTAKIFGQKSNRRR